MALTEQCDVAIAGGGLAACLTALALHRAHPDLDVRLIEQASTLGGEHIWSFFDSDVDAQGHQLIAPLISCHWSGYQVQFPQRRRQLTTGYNSIRSAALDHIVRALLPAERIMTGCSIADLAPDAVMLDNGQRIKAGAVIDARGMADLSTLDLGWQKFVGQELIVPHGHGIASPIIMDATVPQLDGYRFVYALPFTAQHIFVEDTYYSDAPDLADEALDQRITDYAAAQGWHNVSLAHRETGVLPVALGGDIAAYWRSSGDEIAKIGLRAGLFHPTTGYSLPDAVRTATLIAQQPTFEGRHLRDVLHHHSMTTWRNRGFYRLLDRMLFRAAEPDQRYRIMQRFYGLQQHLIERFYAAHSTFADKTRILIGKPPVPISKALGLLMEKQKGHL